MDDHFAPPPLQVRYLGSTRFFAKLAAKEYLLTLVTCGLYAPWAWLRLRKYVWRNLRLGDETLEFVAGPSDQVSLRPQAAQALIGLILVRLFALWLGLHSPASAGHAAQASLFAVLSWLHYPTMLAVGGLTAFSGLRFRARWTIWRGQSFRLGGSAWQYVARYTLSLGLAWATVGLYYPDFAIRSRRELYRHFGHGDVSADYSGRAADIRSTYYLGALLSVITLGVYWPWHIARLRNYHWSHISFGPLTVSCQQDGGSLTTLWLGNSLISLFTLGLGCGWVIDRTLRYNLAHLTLQGKLLQHHAAIGATDAQACPMGSAGSGLCDLVAGGLLPF